MLPTVGLTPKYGRRYPPSSGGSASGSTSRELLTEPVVVVDEPVSAFDVSIRAQVLNLLETRRTSST